MSEYDAVPVPMMGPKETLTYLRNRFSQQAHLFGDPENLDPADVEPYFSYNRLAEEVMKRQDDAGLLESFCSLLNEMAVSKEYWLIEVLGDMFEGFAHEEAFIAKLLPHLNEAAREMLTAARGI